jgi:hypothetical protein
MKNLKKIAVMTLFGGLLIACSDDESNVTTDATQPKGELTIKATSGLTAGRPKANVDVSEFMINIRKIEFEYAEGQNTQGLLFAKSDDDDDDEDVNLTFDELPEEIQTYITTNHPDDPFCKAEMENDSDDPYLYEVELQSGLELYFKADFTLYASEQDDEPCGADDDGSDDNSYGSDDEINLAGPFELDLSQGSTTVVDVNIPEGVYEEVEFKMDVSSNLSSPLYQKSILLSGMIDGTPFEFYHTFDEDFEVDYEDAGQNLVIDANNNTSITFNFDLPSVVASVDFSSAVDGNNDGTIQISPVDPDGNQLLANTIKNAIVQYAELIDD